MASTGGGAFGSFSRANSRARFLYYISNKETPITIQMARDSVEAARPRHGPRLKGMLRSNRCQMFLGAGLALNDDKRTVQVSAATRWQRSCSL